MELLPKSVDARQQNQFFDPRNIRQQRLVGHLHKCGPRAVLEAMLDVECGIPLDVVLENFTRLTPEFVEAVGRAFNADGGSLPIAHLQVFEGGGR